MTQSSGAATEAARRLWARSAGDAATPEEVAAATVRAFAQLEMGLSRWVGAEGFRALRGRAHGLVRSAHPALGALSADLGDGQGVVAAVRSHGAREVAAGITSLIAALIDLLGRIIGEEMAVRLVEQTGAANPRRESSLERQGGRDG
jgi:hypothetical protein